MSWSEIIIFASLLLILLLVVYVTNVSSSVAFAVLHLKGL